MKKIIWLVFVICFCSSQIDAQSYLSIPDSAARWINYGYSFSFSGGNFSINNTFGSKYYTDGSDTIINGQNYFGVKESAYYIGSLRNSSGKVYYVPRDSTNEYLLYDFTVQVGDTLHNVFTSYGIVQDLLVTDVTTDSIGGVLRRVIHFNGVSWIEGIGCSQGLFAEPFLNVSNVYFTLMCFSVGDTSHYPSADTAPCDFSINLGLKQSSKNNEFQIFPNPANDFLFVSNSLKRVKSIAIYNSIGVQIITIKNLGNDLYKIPIQDLSIGLYYITFYIDDFIVNRKFIKN